MVFLKDQKLNEDYIPFLLHDSPCVYGCIYFVFMDVYILFFQIQIIKLTKEISTYL